MPETTVTGRRPLEPSEVAGYLAARGVIAAGDDAVVSELAGGVSCAVFAIEAGGRSVVLKQALNRLKVARPWFADPRRAGNEAAALSVLHALTPGATPALLDRDDEAHTLTMTRAPARWTNWKLELLAGAEATDVAGRLGTVLGTWHAGTRDPSHLPPSCRDLAGFQELRITPYHRAVQERHPACRELVDEVVDDMLTHRGCLVHGDFSPKNVLVGGSGMWVLDFEVAHYGDPAFDVAFLLTHLLLKAVHAPLRETSYRAAAGAFLRSYAQVAPADLMATPDRLAGQLGCLLLARVDGTSPVEYLTYAQRTSVRALGLHVLARRIEAVEDIFGAIADRRP